MTIRVLVVEDDGAAMEITSKYVENTDGFTVVGRAYDGESAKAMAYSASPDLLILDVDLPKKNGVELLAELRRENHPARALFLTASNDTAVKARARGLGIVDYLVKPVGYGRFKEALVKSFQPVCGDGGE